MGWGLYPRCKESRIGVLGPGDGKTLGSKKLQRDVGLSEQEASREALKKKGPVAVITFLVFPQSLYELPSSPTLSTWVLKSLHS